MANPGPLQVLALIDSLTGGGAERMTVALSGYLRRQGMGVTVVTLHPEQRDFFTLEPGVDRIALGRVADRSIWNKILVNIRRIVDLRGILKRRRPDVVIGMMTNCAVLSMLAGAGLGTRVIVAERNYPGSKRLLRPWEVLRKHLYRFAAANVVQTDEAGAWLRRHAGAGRIHVIPNPVLWPLPDSAPEVDPRAWLAKGSRCLLAVGTKPRQKGFDLLIEAFARVAGAHPDWTLAILGVGDDGSRSGDTRDALRASAGRAGIGDRLCLPGLAGNMGDWYRRADLFVLSSRYEGFPNALLEAMAAGCPPVSFDCDAGPRDIIEHEVNGLLVPAEDVGALAAALERLMDDAGLRERMAARAAEVRDRFSEEVILQHWCEVVAGTARPSPGSAD